MTAGYRTLSGRTVLSHDPRRSFTASYALVNCPSRICSRLMSEESNRGRLASAGLEEHAAVSAVSVTAKRTMVRRRTMSPGEAAWVRRVPQIALVTRVWQEADVGNGRADYTAAI